MTVRVEWMDAAQVGVEVVPEGTEVGEFDVTAALGLVIAADEAVVIEGTALELLNLTQRITTGVARLAPDATRAFLDQCLASLNAGPVAVVDRPEPEAVGE